MEFSSNMKIFRTIIVICTIISLAYLPVQVQATGRNYYKKLPTNSSILLKRSSFSTDFLFGAGSSAVQIEGSANEAGKGPSIFYDLVEHDKGAYKDVDKFPTLIEHYKRYKKDVQYLKKLGINSYRFSIAWSRIMPDGTLSGGVNQEGVDFYNNLINELLANGITPFVTIMHFDYPLALEEKYGGFMNRSMVNYFKDYCGLLFETYGDRVKHWMTLNEPGGGVLFGYMHGMGPPRDRNNAPKCLTGKERTCTEPYIVAHNYILAHAAAVKLYREKFQAVQGGQIGIVLPTTNYEPYSSAPEDVVATERQREFRMGWFAEPLIYGDYPKIMRELVKDRLPTFTEEEKKLIKGSTDFLGINYYVSIFVKHEPNRTKIILPVDNFDALATSSNLNAEGKILGYKEEASGTYVYPEGLYNTLMFFKEKYQNPKIYICENGIPQRNLSNPLKDTHRINYIARHINYTKAAIEDGAEVKGYFYWGAFDSYEFNDGYSHGYGLYHIDFNNNLKRKPKASAKWYRRFLRGKKLRIPSS